MKECAVLLAVFSAFTASINSALADTFGTGGWGIESLGQKPAFRLMKDLVEAARLKACKKDKSLRELAQTDEDLAGVR